MELKKFASPREEALEIALYTRKEILEGKKDVVSILRHCLVVAKNLNKVKTEEWVMSELVGYSKATELPDYRIMDCPYNDKYGHDIDEMRETKIATPIHALDTQIRRDQKLLLLQKDDTSAVLSPLYLEVIISQVINECLFFLNTIVSELQYGGTIQYLIEEIRDNVDGKLSSADENISEEINSLNLNLSSTNPADWPKVAHSCRRILKFIADYVFPSKDDSYKMKDGREMEIKENHIINRLCAFVDQSLSGDRRKLLLAEINYLESYLRQIVEFTQMGEHIKDISKFDASMIATHTYLIISDILKLFPDKSMTETD